MYVEILCPRCLAAISGRTTRARSSRPSPGPQPIEAAPSSGNANDVEDSLTETDIVEAESAPTANTHDDSAKTE
jgi:hypothetical protein